MSDLENMNIMLGNYPENQSDADLNENVEVDSRSNRTITDMVRNCEDFRTLLTSEDRNRCETTMETNRLFSEEISYQMNRKIDELKRNSDTQITESINSAIHDSILPSIQNSSSGQNSGLGKNADSKSSRLSRNTEGKMHQSAWGNTQNRIQPILNNHPHSRDNSISSLDIGDDHDKYNMIMSVKKWDLFPNLIAVLENSVYLYKIYHRMLTEFTRLKKYSCIQACSM